jgi:beta-RFAP synthase
MPHPSQITRVRVLAPARLHLGFLDLNGSLGRRYGSLGLAVDTPATDITLSTSSKASATGAEQERALKLVERLSSALGLSTRAHVDIHRAIPAHAGLGSGTQLALAIGTGLINLSGREVPARALGELVERGARSSIGMAAFESGGFIVDGGRGMRDAAPPILARVAFPESWRVLLILDPETQGVHGDRETEAFAALAQFPDREAARLCRLLLMQLLPALHESDINSFGAALTEIQKIVGNHFAAAQGGSAWSSREVGQIANKMETLGAKGIGQSSWGPTGFAFADSEAAAQRLYSTLVEEATAKGLQILIARGRNTGAAVSMVSDLDPRQ